MERARLLLARKELVPGIEALLFAADPIGICFEHNTDAYRPEAQLIAARIGEAATIDELHRIVYEEFVRWFGDAGPDDDRYQAIARDIWRLALGSDG